MTEVVEEIEIDSELDTLKARAKMMGISHHPSIGVAKLKAKIESHIEPKKAVKKEVIVRPINPKNKKRTYLTEQEYAKKHNMVSRKNVGRLVRVRITCMNPAKKEWEGEIFSIGSAKLGTFKKYVPFNTEDGWHIPYIMYEMIKDRKFTSFYTVVGAKGNKVRKGKLVPEFAIETLDSLNPEELKELATQQAMANNID